MTAGESADEVARRAAASAERLEQRARGARRRAEAFAAGAEGERLLAEEVAGLTAKGWFMLPDRRTTGGGNIDLLLVGPPGVFVLDAKHWSGVVSQVGLAVGRYDRGGSAVALGALTADVRASIRATGTRVEPILVLTHPANRGHAPRRHQGVLVLSLDHLSAYLSSLPTALGSHEVEGTVQSLMSSLMPAPNGDDSTTGSEGESEEHPRSGKSALFDTFNTYYYVQPWARSGRRRLYLNDEEGRTLAYKDLVSGDVALTDAKAAPHLREILANASASGLGLTKSTVPKVPVSIPGGRLLSSLTRIWMTFHVGHRWRKGSLDRLYCVRADPGHGVDELGHIDLVDGTIHPIHARPLGPDLSAPRRYLELHRERFRTRV